MKAYNLENEEDRAAFLENESVTIPIPDGDRTAIYHSVKKTGVKISTLGTSKAIAIGAYNFAVNQLP